MQSYIKNRVKLWEQIEFKVRNQYLLPSSELINCFPLYFAQSSFTEMNSTFIKLQNESLPKDIGQ